MDTFTIGPYTLEGFVGPQGAPLIYLLGEPDQGDSLWPHLRDRCTLITVTGLRWNQDLSPWPAPKVFSQGEDFSGEGDRFLKILLEELLPQAEARFSPFPKVRGLVGYSLAGLFALYACTQTTCFSHVASVSGSLWYPGFVDYLQTHPPADGTRIYLSLGDRESHSRNQTMAQVEHCTQQARGLLSNTCPVIYEQNPGGHFYQVPQRIVQGITRLLDL